MESPHARPPPLQPRPPKRPTSSIASRVVPNMHKEHDLPVTIFSPPRQVTSSSSSSQRHSEEGLSASPTSSNSEESLSPVGRLSTLVPAVVAEDDGEILSEHQPASPPHVMPPSLPSTFAKKPPTLPRQRSASRRVTSMFADVDVPSFGSVPRHRKVQLSSPTLTHLADEDAEMIMCPSCMECVPAETIHEHVCYMGKNSALCSLTYSAPDGSGSLTAPVMTVTSTPPLAKTNTGSVTCDMCGVSVPLQDALGNSNAHGVLFTSCCNHAICAQCARAAGRDTLTDLKRALNAVSRAEKPRVVRRVMCPVSGCDSVLSQNDVFQVLGPDVYAALADTSFEVFANKCVGSSSWVRCPKCAVPIEHVRRNGPNGLRNNDVSMHSMSLDNLSGHSPSKVLDGLNETIDSISAGNPLDHSFQEDEELLQHEIASLSAASNHSQLDVSGTSLIGKKLNVASNAFLMQLMDGKPVSQAAISHFSQNRLRCTNCLTVFCGSCLEAPYHIGMTCEEYKRQQTVMQCRFCDNEARPPSPSGFFNSFFRKNRCIDACSEKDCLKLAEEVCHKVLPCGHPCCGLPGEEECLPCLHPDCKRKIVDECADDFCGICYVDPLKAGACIQLECGHIFHYNCIVEKLERRWPGARITFSFLKCPRCNAEISHPSLTNLLGEINELRSSLHKMMALRLEHEGLHKHDIVVNPSGEFYNDPIRYATHVLSYYQCFKCRKPYFGGFKRCEAAMPVDEERGQFNPEELVCSACIPGNEVRECPIHGTDFIEYKCKFCCSVAQWYCWGSTHFCTNCHKRQEQGDYVTKKKLCDLPQCKGKKHCPLGVDHPPNGTAEFALGCALCRQAEAKNF